MREINLTNSLNLFVVSVVNIVAQQNINYPEQELKKNYFFACLIK